MDMKAMLADLKKLLEDNKMTFDLKKNTNMDKLFRKYIKEKAEVKEHMAKQAVHELIVAETLKKGGFEYADYTKELKLLNDNTLEKLKGIVKGNADEANIEKVAKYMMNNKLANLNKQVDFIKHHYAMNMKRAKESEALAKGSKVAEELETTAESESLVAAEGTETKPEALVELEASKAPETSAELNTPATTEDSEALAKGSDMTEEPKAKNSKTKKGSKKKNSKTKKGSDAGEDSKATTEDSDVTEPKAKNSKQRKVQKKRIQQQLRIQMNWKRSWKQQLVITAMQINHMHWTTLRKL